MDLFDKCSTDQGYYGKLRQVNDYYFTRPILDPKPGPVMMFEGKEHIMWSVNSYLGLTDHPEIRKAAVEAAEEYGPWAPMGSRMMSGTTPHHLELEKELADFSRKEDAVLFNYGYMGVIGAIGALCGNDDTIVMDKLSHASLVDGVFLSQSPFRIFRHNDMDSLERTLKKINRNRKGGILIVLEGTYGMTGDLAKLTEICSLKEKYGARIFVDDAHGVGALGHEGRGTADHLGVHDKIDVYFGTFAKAFASIGGFASGDHRVIEWIKYNARTQVFAKSLPMIYVKTIRKTLQIIRNGDDLRRRMWENAHRIKAGFRSQGYFVGPGDSPIVSVFMRVGDEDANEAGMRFIKYIRDQQIFVSGVTWPVIPHGLFMFRIIPTAAHTFDQVDRTLAAFEKMKQDSGLDLQLTHQDLRKVNALFGIRG